MRILMVFLILSSLNSSANETLWPEAAVKFLKSMDCEFAAFTVYLGPSAGILVKGQAKSIALCGSTYEENGALKKKFCWLRSLDMKKGIYTSNDRPGSVWREENTSCSKESLTKIVNKESVKGQIQFKAAGSEWRVVTDKHGIEKTFLNLVPKDSK